MTDRTNFEIHLDVSASGSEEMEAKQREFAHLNSEILAFTRNLKAAMSASFAFGRARASGSSAASDESRSSRDALDFDRQRYAELRKTFAFKSRMGRQEKAEAAAAVKAERERQAEVERGLREQLAFNAKIAREREAAETATERAIRDQIRETTRLKDRENRKAADQARRLKASEEKAAADAKKGVSQVRSGTGRVVAAGAATGAAAGYAAERGAAAITRSSADLDEAANKNLRLGNLKPSEAAKAGEALKANAMRIGQGLGIQASEYLKARAEALQAGVEDDLVDTFTETFSKYAILNDMPLNEATENAGYGITGLSAFGKVDKKTIEQLANKQQYLAATTSASRQGLNSFMRRGMPAGAAAGFNVDDTLAYGAAFTSAGGDGESAARALSSTTETLAMAPTKAKDIARHKHKTQKDKNFLTLPKKLGFNNWKDVKAAFSTDAAGTMEKLHEGISQIHDPRERLELSEELWGKEFGGTHAAMAMGHRFKSMRQAVRNPDASTAIDSGMAIKQNSYKFILDQIGVTVENFKSKLGDVLLPFWKDLRDWAVQTPTAFGQFQNAMKSGLEGILEGFGGPGTTFAGLIKKVLGDPKDFSLNAEKFKQFGKGFATGIREAFESIKSVVGVFTGSKLDPEAIGRLAGKFIALSIACIALAPVLAVLGGLTTILLGLVTIGRAAASLTSRLAGGARPPIAPGPGPRVGAAPGGAPAAGGLAARVMGWLRFGPLAAAFSPLTMDAGREDQNTLMRRLGAFAREQEAIRNGAAPAVPGHALGGMISGPGSGTSDSILARLSAGEFVVNAEAASRHAGLLHAINGGATGYALGGTVGQTPGSASFRQSPFQDLEARRLNDILASLVRELQLSRKDGVFGELGSRPRRNRRLQISEGDSNARAAGGAGGSSGGEAGAPGGGSGGGPLESGMRRRGIIGGGTGGQGGGQGGAPEPEGGTRTGGSRSWRNNNPGNIEYGPFARRMGATGSDGRFARFPNYQAGRNAQEKLLFEGANYKNLTLAQAIRRWAPASENNVPAYLAAMGGNANTRMGEFTPQQRSALLDRMQQHEGWRQGQIAGGTMPAAAGGAVGAAGATADSVLATAQRLRTANAQCVSLAKAAVSSTASVRTWQRGANAQDGTLQPGTPVATFLNRDGSQSNRYAGGGTGTPGAGLDHAGIFQGYVRDRNGNITGIRMAEQYAGSGGVHSRVYPFGSGRGERNGSNYAAVLGPDGLPLGGSRNPMTAARGNTDTAAAAARGGNPAAGMSGTAGAAGDQVGPVALRGPAGGLGGDTPLGNNAPIRTTPVPAGGGGQSGAPGVVNNHVTVNGSNLSPQEMSGAVQRALQDQMNRRTHDYDGHS